MCSMLSVLQVGLKKDSWQRENKDGEIPHGICGLHLVEKVSRVLL